MTRGRVFGPLVSGLPDGPTTTARVSGPIGSIRPCGPTINEVGYQGRRSRRTRWVRSPRAGFLALYRRASRMDRSQPACCRGLPSLLCRLVQPLQGGFRGRRSSGLPLRSRPRRGDRLGQLSASGRPDGPTTEGRVSGPVTVSLPSGPTTTGRRSGPLVSIRPEGPITMGRVSGPTPSILPSGPIMRGLLSGPLVSSLPLGPITIWARRWGRYRPGVRRGQPPRAGCRGRRTPACRSAQ